VALFGRNIQISTLDAPSTFLLLGYSPCASPSPPPFLASLALGRRGNETASSYVLFMNIPDFYRLDAPPDTPVYDFCMHIRMSSPRKYPPFPDSSITEFLEMLG